MLSLTTRYLASFLVLLLNLTLGYKSTTHLDFCPFFHTGILQYIYYRVSRLVFLSVAQTTCLGWKSHSWDWILSLILSLSPNTFGHVIPSTGLPCPELDFYTGSWSCCVLVYLVLSSAHDLLCHLSASFKATTSGRHSWSPDYRSQCVQAFFCSHFHSDYQYKSTHEPVQK